MPRNTVSSSWPINVMLRNDAGVPSGWPSLASLIVANSRVTGFRDGEKWRMVPALPPVGSLKRSLVMLATPVICVSSSDYPQPALSKHSQAVLARPAMMPPLSRDRWDVTSLRESGRKSFSRLGLQKEPKEVMAEYIWTWC